MVTVGVVRHRSTRERRVALAPDAVCRLVGAGLEVLAETGVGADAYWSDDKYANAGAQVLTRAEVLARSSLLVTVTQPDVDVLTVLRSGQVVVGWLDASSSPDLVDELAARGVRVASFDGLPRTLSRAQAMDALTSQANVSGYKAVLVAANALGRYFPMLVTAAGTARPARVLVLGVGVAGLQAIGTARRLGALVSAYDIRPAAKAEAASVGADFLPVDQPGDGAGTGGYARSLSDEEQADLRDALAEQVGRFAVVITTARVPGRRPPLLLSETAVKAMDAGCVVVDLAASPVGGNVAGSRFGETVVTPEGVIILGTGDLAAEVPVAASEAYSRNLTALLSHLVRDGELVLDADDEICAGILLGRPA
jgi:NAD(P) transhydrogenase subunit alpha